MEIFNQYNVNSLLLQMMQQNEQRMTQALDRVASGKRITSAVDDPSGLSIASRLQTRSTENDTLKYNLLQERNFFQRQDTALQGSQQLLQRMRELALTASSDHASEGRAHLDSELQMILEDYNEQTPHHAMSSIEIGTKTGASSALQAIDAAMEAVRNERSTVGATVAAGARREVFFDNMARENVRAQSRIQDADTAKEVSELLKHKFQNEVSIGMLHVMEKNSGLLSQLL